MTPEVHQTPDGLVFIRTDVGVYGDALENLALDFAHAMPSLPEGADDRLYVQGVRHALMGGGNLIAAGEMPWEMGDRLINSVAPLLAIQAARRNPAPTLEQTKLQKLAQIEVEFQQRATLPIGFVVAGIQYEWDADEEAVRNITGVVLLIAAGVPVPNPRTWSPKGALTPVTVTHMDLVGLGTAIAARKDTLFFVKKQKQAAVQQLTQVADVQAYDVTQGWS